MTSDSLPMASRNCSRRRRDAVSLSTLVPLPPAGSASTPVPLLHAVSLSTMAALAWSSMSASPFDRKAT